MKLTKSWISLIALTFATACVSLLNYLQLSTTSLQQIALLLLIFILSILKWRFKQLQQSYGWRLIVLALGSILVQLLVVSTGGFLSPFLITLHLFALGLAFTLTFNHSMIFLLAALVLLFGQLIKESDAAASFSQDPGTTILYILSFFAVIPLAYILHNQYKVKDALLASFEDRLKISDAILESLDDFVVMTDEQANILTVNQATEKFLGLSVSQLRGLNLFDMFYLRLQDGQLANIDYFNLNEAKNTENTVTYDQLSLLRRNTLESKSVQITITSIRSIELNQRHLSWVIRDVQSALFNQFDVFSEQLRLRAHAILEIIDAQLINRQQQDLSVYVGIMKHFERDALTFDQIKVPQFEYKPAKVDVYQLCQRICQSEQRYATAFGIDLNLRVPAFETRPDVVGVAGQTKFSPQDVSGAFFTSELDPIWFARTLEAGLGLCILISAGSNSPIEVILDHKDSSLSLTFKATNSNLSGDNLHDLLKLNYGAVQIQNSPNIGSGIEGYLFQQLCTKQGLHLNLAVDTQMHQIVFVITMPSPSQIHPLTSPPVADLSQQSDRLLPESLNK